MRIRTQIHRLFPDPFRYLQNVLLVGVQDPVMVTHFDELLLSLTFHTAQVDAWRILEMPDIFHNQLDLECEGFVLLLAHPPPIRHIDQDRNPSFQPLLGPLLAQLFHGFFLV